MSKFGHHPVYFRFGFNPQFLSLAAAVGKNVVPIAPPADITEAMSRQMKAEGDAKARILRAEAEAAAIQKVAAAAEKSFKDKAQILRRLEVAEKVLSGPATKWVLPTSGELVNVLNLGGGSIIPVKK